MCKGYGEKEIHKQFFQAHKIAPSEEKVEI